MTWAFFKIDHFSLLLSLSLYIYFMRLFGLKIFKQIFQKIDCYFWIWLVCVQIVLSPIKTAQLFILFANNNKKKKKNMWKSSHTPMVTSSNKQCQCINSFQSHISHKLRNFFFITSFIFVKLKWILDMLALAFNKWKFKT